MGSRTTGLRRWVCPTCGRGGNAPTRPRRDDIRRYCLPCSQRTGRLVERVAPSLERERQQARERAAAKRTRARDRQRESAVAAYTVGEFDLIAEAARMWRLPVLRQQARWTPRTPTVDVRRSKTKRHTSGRCWPATRHIVITVGTDPADCLVTLLHELIHACLPVHTHHADPFYRVFRSAAREAWPTAEFRFNELPPRAGGAKWHGHVANVLRKVG